MTSNIIFRWILNFFELMACIVAIMYWGKSKFLYLQTFTIILCLILATELLGKYFSFHTNLQKFNPMLYRYWGTTFQFLFFYWLYFQNIKNSKAKFVPILISVAYVASWIIDEIFKIKNDWKWFPSLSFGIGVIGILLLVVQYFFSLMNNEKIIFFYKEPIFWISTGLLVGYITIIPLYVLRNGLDKEQLNLFTIYWKIGVTLNCIMYIFFSISFICTKKKL